MKKLLLSVVFGLALALPCFAAQLSEKNPETLANVRIVGKTNKPFLSYKPGEEMVFTFTLDTGKDLPGNWNFHYRRGGDDNNIYTGKAPVNQPLVVKTSLNKTGFVYVEVTLHDANGKRIYSETVLPNKARRKNTIIFAAGAAVEPESLKDCGEPADFDAFWAKQLKRLAAVPFAGKVEKKLVKQQSGVDVYAVSIPCAGPRPATGYLTIPQNAKAKSLPIHVIFFGYGISKQSAPSVSSRTTINFYVNAHGQKLEQDAEYYKEFFKSIGGKAYAYNQETNKDPEACFFNGMALRDLRAVEYAKSLPEWNGKDLIIHGSSQGGLQSMWVAALDPQVSVVNPAVTWCCDIAGTLKQNRLGAAGRIKYTPALEYYDAVFMAKRIKNAKVVITRAGMGDYTSPPSGLAICYNNLATPDKTIKWYQGSDHSFIPKPPEIIIWKSK